jgi:hypothetical protein
MTLTKKSRLASLFLTLLLGPIGLMYSSAIGGFIMLVLIVVTLPTVVVPIGLWFLCVVIGDSATHKHNKGIDSFAKMMRG